MKIIIDGYNLLKQILKTDFVKSQDRTQFLNRLASYGQKRGHSLVVIFDGGQSTWPYKKNQRDVEIIFTGDQASADEYIIKGVADKTWTDPLIVTSDKAIWSQVQQYGVDVLSSYEFYSFVQGALSETVQPEGNNQPLQKQTKRRSGEVDAVMQQAAENVSIKKEDQQTVVQQGFVSRAISKRLEQKLRKL